LRENLNFQKSNFFDERKLNIFNHLENSKIKFSKKEIYVVGKKPKPRYRHTMTLYREEIIIIGGEGLFENSVHIFNIQTNTFLKKRVNGKPLNISKHSSTLFHDNIIIFGGFVNGEISNSTFHLSLITYKWREYSFAFQPPKISNHLAVRVGSEMFVFFGRTEVVDVLNDEIFVFNVETCKWSTLTQRGEIPKPRIGSTCQLIKNENILFYGGGVFQNHEWIEFFKDVFIFNVKNKSWSLIDIHNTIHQPIGSTFSKSILIDGYLYIFGGGRKKAKVTNKIGKLDLIRFEWMKEDFRTTKGDSMECLEFNQKIVSVSFKLISVFLWRILHGGQ
jgi:N-acetylneuraminic acid mutarotase